MFDVTQEMWDALEEKLRKNNRQKAKAVVLGANYLMGPDKLKIYAHSQFKAIMTKSECKDLLTRYKTIAYPGIGKLHEQATLMQQRGVCKVTSLSGRYRQWNEPAPASGAVNFPIQGLSADIIKNALGFIYRSLKKAGYHPVMSRDVQLVICVHDSIGLLAKDKGQRFLDGWKNMLDTDMIKAAEEFIDPQILPITVDGAISDTYAEV
jgi:DNA polymerase I-like protein with 3'-5' exonuclease and polymerase domains